MKRIIHVNQHKIKANRKDGGSRAVLSCKTYKTNDYGNSAKVIVNGEVLGEFKYCPEKPLSCGAHVWFETQADVVIE